MNDFYINPYNFIPYQKDVIRENDDTSSELLTGEIRCSLTVKTPLAIPDAAERYMSQFYEEVKKQKSRSGNKAANDKDHHYIYPFMTAGGVPVIPGSELRGMVRNVYETITNSCFSIINCNTLSKRDNLPLPEPGLLQWNEEFNEWRVYEAAVDKKLTKEKLDQLVREYEGQEFAVRTWTLFTSIEKTWKSKGYTNKTVFVKKSSYLLVEDEKVNTLKEILALYKQYDEKGAKQFDKVMPEKDGKLYPVFFDTEVTEDDEIVTRLAPAQISRSIFKNSVDKMLGRTGHAPCTHTDRLCPACRLFGTVMQDGAVSSKLRFSDAVGDHVTLYPAKMDKSTRDEDVPTLRELSSPRLTSIEFYSLPENINKYTEYPKWDYDDDRKGIYLRGRKIYLHNPKAELKPGEDPRQGVFCIKDRIKDTTNRNSSMQLATNGGFGFSVYFNGITENELKTLVWALTLGDADGTTALHHKLGHGRPLGLGSIKLKVDKIVKRTTDGNTYAMETQEISADYFSGFTLPIEGTDTLIALNTVSDFHYTGENTVAYPIGTVGGKPDNDNNTMQWFSRNHGKVGKNGNYQHVLHPIVTGGKAASAHQLRLPHLFKKGVTQSGNPNGSSGSSGHRGNTPKPLELNAVVDARITGNHTAKNGKLYIDFDAMGNKGNLPAFFFSKDIENNPDKAIGQMIKVKFTGKNGIYNQFKLVR